MTDTPRQDPDPTVDDRTLTSRTIDTGDPDTYDDGGGYVSPRGRRNGMGVAALVIGVLSLVLALLVIFFPIAGLLGLIAIFLGIVALGRVRRGEADNRGQAWSGLLTGLIGLGIAVVLTIRIGDYFSDHQSDFRTFGTCLTNSDTNDERASCLTELSDQLDDDPAS